jgi:hypothetical protein
VPRGQDSDPAVRVASVAPAAPGAADTVLLRLRGAGGQPAGAAPARLARGGAGLEPVRALPAGGPGGAAAVYGGGVDKAGSEVVVWASLGASGLELQAVPASGPAAAAAAAAAAGRPAGLPGLDVEEHGGLSAVFAGPYVKRDGGGPAMRALVVTAAGAVALVQQERVAWVRHEGLASVTQARRLALECARARAPRAPMCALLATHSMRARLARCASARAPGPRAGSARKRVRCSGLFALPARARRVLSSAVRSRTRGQAKTQAGGESPSLQSSLCGRTSDDVCEDCRRRQGERAWLR